MRASHPAAVLMLLLGLPVADARPSRPAPGPCPDDVAAAIAERCPCDGASTHGDYVSCVVRYRKALRRSGCLSDAGRAIARCAARSTCGKPIAVVCCMPCDAGVDCVTPWARIARDEATCAAAGGTPGGQGSACAGCTSPTSTTTTTSPSTSSSTTTTTTLAPGLDVGNDVEFPNASAHSPDYLLGGFVTLPAPGMLTHLCVITKAGGPNVILTLYSDGGGDPAHLMALTAATPMTLGRMEIPVTPTPLAAGTYWIMGVYDADASIGIDETDPGMPVRYTGQPFSSPLPNPFGAALEYTGQQFNYYLVVQ